MTSSPEPAVAGVEELHFSIPVAGSDSRWEPASHIVFGRADVFRPDGPTLARYAQLVDRDTWQYSYVVLPVDLEPLQQGHYRQVSVTATFANPGIVAKHDMGAGQALHGGVAPTRGVGSSRVTWVLEPGNGEERLRPEGHQLGCLVQRPTGSTVSEVVIEVSVRVMRGLAVLQERTATMKEPRRYQLSFVKNTFARLPGQGDEEGVEPVVHIDVRTPEFPTQRNRMLIVFHGRDHKARRELYAFLRAIDLHPIEWTQVLELTGQGAPYIGDALDAAMNAAQAILVLMTPDEVVYLKPEQGDGPDDPELAPQGQARPNVLFEAGLAFGRFPDRTVLVEFGKVRPLSDLGGRYVVRLTDSSQSRQKLAKRLEAVGCAVNLNGTDWLSAGDLTPPSAELPSPPGTAAAPSRTPQGATASAERPPAGGRTEPITFDKVVAKSDASGNHIVYGEIVSAGSDVSLMTIDATFYDTNEEILGAAQGLVSGLTAGHPKNFQLITFDDVAGYADIRLQVNSRLP
ncbi:TIR domain-containing protein [Streptomyces microflavus]|uniref:TIR domain-containing protein n=1 Tax=Streptomyces microflavus TaxID=1919 RepID=UPI00380855F6